MAEPDSPKWGGPEQTHTVRFFHERIRARVAERARSLDRPWREIATTHTLELLDTADLLSVERELLEQGYRFDCSATISQREAPEKYQAPTQAAATSASGPDEQGRVLVGQGDNLVQAAANLRGTARFISSIDQVTEMLIDGVPDDTVAVIDDSGGTLTAPILEGFKAVLCKGGTVRSHLGILTREYGIPCFMNCQIDPLLADGDRVELELTARAVAGEDYETGRSMRARVWKLSGELA